MFSLRFFLFHAVAAIGVGAMFFLGGCAQIGMPAGGPRDTIAPVLMHATPENKTLHFKGNKIVLTFDEYVQVTDNSKVLISPYQNKTPQINYNLRTVTLRLRDTLRPNTTYSINFNNTLTDVNENNPLLDFVYVFSTGDHLDSLSFSGKSIVAETGLPDSTAMAYLYDQSQDSTVLKHKPRFIVPLKGDGSFQFDHLPTGVYHLYLLKDGDGKKTYNSPSEAFAFLPGDSAITLPFAGQLPVMRIFEKKKFQTPNAAAAAPKAADKTFKYTVSAQGGTQDILLPLVITFNRPVRLFDSSKISITDTLRKQNFVVSASMDSTRKIASFQVPWAAGTAYILTVPKSALSDTLGNAPGKDDTLRFRARTKDSYGHAVLRFPDLDLAAKPVLQLYLNDVLVLPGAITGSQYDIPLLNAGEYTIKILYDTNGNGVWDTGDYAHLLQPEEVVTIVKKLNVRADWDNEADILLSENKPSKNPGKKL